MSGKGAIGMVDRRRVVLGNARFLRELGIACKTHSARVVMLTPREQAPRTHMFLTVGEDVLDPGFGGFAPLVPVPIGGRAGVHRIVRDGDVVALEIEQGRTWVRLWLSTLEHDHPIDFEMANHFTSTWPRSSFVTSLTAQRSWPEKRVILRDRELVIREGRLSETTTVRDPAHLLEVLETHFDLVFPAGTRFRQPEFPE